MLAGRLSVVQQAHKGGPRIVSAAAGDKGFFSTGMGRNKQVRMGHW